MPSYDCAATVVSALFTAPAQKRKRDGAAAGADSSAVRPASGGTDAGSSGRAATAAQGAPAAKRAAVGTVRPAAKAAVIVGVSTADGAAHSTVIASPTPGVRSGSAHPEHAASDGGGPRRDTDAAAAADGGDAVDGAAAIEGNGSVREADAFLCQSDPLAADGARLPFPPEHYVATIAELEVHEFPLPQAGADAGELVCPPGFVATRRKSACRDRLSGSVRQCSGWASVSGLHQSSCCPAGADARCICLAPRPRPWPRTSP